MPPTDPQHRSGNGAQSSGNGGAANTSEELSSLRSLTSDLLARLQFATAAGLPTTHFGKRNLYYDLGYAASIAYKEYRFRYDRGGIAKRIVDCFPKAAWVEGIAIVEDPDPETATGFETAAESLFTRLNVISVLQRAHILARIGQYGAILIGAPGALNTPLPRLSGPDSVIYLRPLSEANAKIKSPLIGESALHTGSDITEAISSDPRFGLPEFYQVRVGKSAYKDTHWTRIIHITEGVLDEDLYGEPALQSVWNYLDDLDKLVGGGSEAAWKRMDPGMQLDYSPSDPVAELDPSELEKIRQQVDDFRNGLSRTLYTRDVSLNLLAASVASFGANSDTVLSLIAGTKGIPVRIFKGSERGELASTQDDDNWNDRVTEYVLESCIPSIRLLINRLIEHGALPTPVQYEPVWPSEEELTEDEKVDMLARMANANKAQNQAGQPVIWTSNELRDKVGLEPLEDEDIADDGEGVEADSENDGSEDDGDTTEGETLPRAARHPARHLASESADEPEWRSVHRAADDHIPSLTRFLISAWQDIGLSLDTRLLESAIDRRDIESAEREVLAALNLGEAALVSALPDRLLAVVNDGGQAAVRSARSRGGWRANQAQGQGQGQGHQSPVLRSSTFSTSFTLSNPRSISWAALRSSALITQIGPDTRAAIRQLISTGIQSGIAPVALARQVRDSIGLRSDQLTAVANLRARLASARPGSLVMAGKTRIRIPKSGVTSALIDQRAAQYTSRLRNQRARLIARTETLRAANEGQREAWRQAKDRGELSPDQKRVWLHNTDRHAAMGGQQVGIDEPFSPPIEPGEEPNCLLPGAYISGRVVAGLKANYSGPAREIKTARGYRLSVTGNHPILTSNGWLAANCLVKGMQLVSESRQIDTGLADVDYDYPPALIDDIFESFRLCGSTVRETTTHNLHGDALWTDREVNIVGAYRKLVFDRGTGIGERLSEFQLPGSDASRNDPLIGRLSSSDFGLNGVSLSLSSDPSMVALLEDRGPIVNDLVPDNFPGFGCAANWYILKKKSAGQDFATDAGFIGQLLDRSSGQVSFDEIVEIRDFHFRGHVYDLETVTGWMLADGIVISNCGCAQGLV